MNSTNESSPRSLFSFDGPRLKQEWFGNVRADLLAGAAVALALIPEAIAFSNIAGVAPKIGLYASFTIAVTAAIFGGRPGMISAATGAMALLMVPLVAQHGLEYLFAATILTGFVQIAFRLLRLSRYIKFVPRSVMTGFVNALAILIFMAQMPHFKGANWTMYALVAAGLATIFILPRFTKLIPAPLATIVVLTLIVTFTGTKVHNVGDMGELPNSFPVFHLPQVPFNLETLKIIWPFSVAMGMVGLIESLLTATVVDEMTDTGSDKHRVAYGQGLANIITGFFGGMAGCAMIGQSVINVRSGGRGRLSTFSAGIYLLIFCVVFGDWVTMIPTGALIAVMFTVSYGTFDWKNLSRLKILPIGETFVTVATVTTVLLTHDLSKGVLVGVLLSAILFARSVGKLISIDKTISLDGRRVYAVTGQLFFVSVEDFLASFDLTEKQETIEIDMSQARLWDTSAVSALDRIMVKMRANGSVVHLSGLDDTSNALLTRVSLADDEKAALAAH